MSARYKAHSLYFVHGNKLYKTITRNRLNNLHSAVCTPQKIAEWNFLTSFADLLKNVFGRGKQITIDENMTSCLKTHEGGSVGIIILIIFQEHCGKAA